jgi:hypothetical protein
VKTTYNGTEITYNERTDRWEFELRGSSRSAETLSKAKEVIEKPAPKDKTPFTRTPAFYRGYSGDGYQKVEVTSIANSSSLYGGKEVWVSIPTANAKRGDGRPERTKVRTSDLRAYVPENVELVDKMRVTSDAIAKLENEKTRLAEQMKAFELPANVEVPE